MKQHDLAEKLIDLCQLDIDAIIAYRQAIVSIEDPELRRMLDGFRTDHENHVLELANCIIDFGARPPEFKKDFKGFVIEGMTAVAGGIGSGAALMAMLGNETLTNARYKAAQSLAGPGNVMALLAKNYQDEQRHISSVRAFSALKNGKISDLPLNQLAGFMAHRHVH